MNHTTRFFNGTRDGSPYQARVTEAVRTGDDWQTTDSGYEIEIVIFDKATGESHYAFERRVFGFSGSMRAAVRAVIANPDNF